MIPRVHRTILAGVDFTPLGDIAVASACAIADRLGAERLHLVHVMQSSPSWAMPLTEGLAQAWQVSFESISKQLDGIELPPTNARVTRKTLLGGAAFELAREAREVGADMIVVATHKRGTLKRLVLGSVAASLIRNAECPVLVVGADRPATKPIKNVLAAIDLSPISDDVLAEAVAVARPERAVVRALSLYEIPQLIRDDQVLARFLTPEEVAQFPSHHRSKVNELIDRIHADNVEIIPEAVDSGHPARVILETAQKTAGDLIVIGTSGHNAIERAYLGSTAGTVIADAECPVLVIPSDKPKR